MSLGKTLRRMLLLGFLAVAALNGAKMTQEEIENLMNAMHRVQVVEVKKKEREVD